MTTTSEATADAGSYRHSDVEQLLRAATTETGDAPVLFETHGARVYVGRSRALKIKRPLRYPYMDFSTLEKRHAALARELEINQAAAPRIYRRLVAVTEAADGALALDGPGRTIEWALEMRSFRQQDVLAEIAAKGPLGAELAKATADAVFELHRRAPSHRETAATLTNVITELAAAFAASPETFDRTAAVTWRRRAEEILCRVGPILEARRCGGSVRRCHGDLHLGNIVLWQGKPTPFDALEFDEALATIDVLYDLAFLLMDLDQRGLRADANTVMNRYLWRSGRADDLDGLAAMPLYLSLRAGIRAMVAAQKAALGPAMDQLSEARRYFEATGNYLADRPPMLLAIGGLSGTGKTTLATALAPALGRAPGAVHLRSDLERKTLAGIGEFDRLPPSAYTPEAARLVYERLYDHAARTLAAGQSVVVDAVFGAPEERAQIEQIARSHAAHREFVWLVAPRAVLKARVAARVGDASDATPEVVDLQIARGTGSVDWRVIEAGSTAEATRAIVRQRLGL